MKLLGSVLTYAFLLSLCFASSVSCFAQGYRPKQIAYQTSQSLEVFGFEADTSDSRVEVDFDSAGLYLTSYQNDLPYVSLNNGSSWRTLLSPDVRPAGRDQEPFRSIIEMGGGKVLAAQDWSSAQYVTTTYLTDGNAVTPLLVSGGAINRFTQLDNIPRRQMEDNRLSFRIFNSGPSLFSAFYDLQGDTSQLQYQSPYIDPISGQRMYTPRDIQPYTEGIVFSSAFVQPNDFREIDGVYQVYQGSLDRLFTFSDLFPGIEQQGIHFVDNLTFSDGNFFFDLSAFDHSYNGTYYVGSDLRPIRLIGDQDSLSGVPGRFWVRQSMFSGDTAAFHLFYYDVEATTPTHGDAFVVWRNGQYEVMDLFPSQNGLSYRLNHFYRGELFIGEQDYYNNPTGGENFTLYRYTLAASVPEPSALIFGLAGIVGLTYMRRKRRIIAR